MRWQRYLIRALQLVWALWFSIVTATNIADALRELGVLPSSWTLVSGNFALLERTTAVHGVPSAINGLLFGGVIAWELTASALFWRGIALDLRSDRARAQAALLRAFTSAIALFGAFLLADEIFVAYAMEGKHLQLLIALLVSVVAILELERGFAR